ncbi:ribosomal protection-like ABC-F family protein [Paenibacillus sp.]|uniref:ribosomal protection-like ABC-F family protein n=1 Tax=Paenibacillus sp. TaxID=58172 RepID=UPI002D645A4B|nr:ABC-F family ATP-binding cassette domain-containing protein [Paenibacillus sp.]HZG84459.1 ABC-F family ATP-binding cassette domain-containing protein [Paenibacillus sp.]
MFIVKANGVSKEWGGQRVFRGVTMDVREGEKLAVFGRNGAGKTTLLGVLRGDVEPNEGTVQRFVPAEAWGLLEQRPERPEESESTVTIDYVRAADAGLAAAREELLRRERELREASEAEAPDASALEAAAARYAEALDAYAARNGYAWEAEVERALAQVGLPPRTWSLPLAALSGGERTRAALARLLVRRPKALFLDEPTNHLDADTVVWLQSWLRAYPGAVVVVSHDRTFLDAVVDRIVELGPDGAKSYKGNYAAYREQKELERRTQIAAYRKQERERENILESIRMYQQWYLQASRDAAKAEGITKPYYAARANKHTARYHAKEKELERLEKERVEKPREAEQLRVAFREGTFEAKTLIEAEGVAFGYEGESAPIVREGRLAVGRGDKIAVVGANGAGKTTLLRLLAGELTPAGGSVRRHPELRVGYFSQRLEGLDPNETLLDSLLRVPDMTQTFARTILGCFLFSRDDAFRRIGELSMGERCRAAFLQLYFSGANLLVLDEPTNYLDVDARERMEEALAAYPGALIAASHDRYFLRAVANRVVSLPGDGSWRVYDMPYAEYERRPDGPPASAEEREREDAYRRAELERAALMAKTELDDEGRERLRELTRVLEEIEALRQS